MIYYSPFHLKPIKKLNHSASKEYRGIYLKWHSDGKCFFAEYFPHPNLGDQSVEEFLKSRCEKQILRLFKLATLTPIFRPFYNHGLPKAGPKFVKVKLFEGDEVEKAATQYPKAKLRLDANGGFDLFKLNKLLAPFVSQIEYIEDPSTDLAWDTLIVKSASDFIENPKADFLIFKPYRKEVEDYKRVIFSSSMGSDLGRAQCAFMLAHFGNLNLYHGIHTPGIYAEQDPNLFLPMGDQIRLNELSYQRIIEGLKKREWHEF